MTDTSAPGATELPEGWERVAADGPGPFVTSEVLRAPDGSLVRWRSRLHRKGAPGRVHGVWWRPDRVSWWIGLLFAIGSACFALAAIVSQWASVSRPGIGVTYFVGSIFFTVAGYLQFSEAVNVEHGPVRGAARCGGARVVGAATDRLAGVGHPVRRHAVLQRQHVRGHEARLRRPPDQPAGVDAGRLRLDLLPRLERARLRRGLPPLGLPARAIAVVADRRAQSPRLVAFGVSAVPSLVEPSTREPVSAAIANAGTAAGRCASSPAPSCCSPRPPGGTIALHPVRVMSSRRS